MKTAEGAFEADPSLAAAHRSLLADRSYQFELEPAPAPPEPPGWLEALLESAVVRALFDAFGKILEVVFWLGLAAIGVGIAFLLTRALRSHLGSQKGRPEAGAADPYTPSHHVLRDLLREADALAGQGDYAAAARLLLHRSIEDVARNRPGMISRAMTAREIGRLPILSDSVGEAYGTIARLVEKAHYARRPIGAADYDTARQLYGLIGTEA